MMAMDEDMMRATLRTVLERLATAEKRLALHDRQLADLAAVDDRHEAAVLAFGAAMNEITNLRKELGLLSENVAGLLEP